MNHKYERFLQYLAKESPIKTKIQVFGYPQFLRIIPYLLTTKIVAALEVDPIELQEALGNRTVEDKEKLRMAKLIGLNGELFEKTYTEYLKSFLR